MARRYPYRLTVVALRRFDCRRGDASAAGKVPHFPENFQGGEAESILSGFF